MNFILRIESSCLKIVCSKYWRNGIIWCRDVYMCIGKFFKFFNWGVFICVGSNMIFDFIIVEVGNLFLRGSFKYLW